ncbi:uncharacterized protein PHALS_08281 [Plasmopara halstedii]|uniref:Uncharacterized protein n=1 Tax=Plasmopara halstedii TaxID=4781 RepID=A0A0P1ABZ2_PLAHL|nr:uncharacterized protein PHALS_08281 [Plasmopara halstedii]CEG38194.1 hypothetical protein PHALS_08281 [Plasmopara halstedii]|eukprot:XP_024574563.1 hypothetical protein PHALS_08281 [Plasmopara halstedii]
MKFISVLTTVAAIPFLKCVEAIDIDNGLTHDGTTTYCMGVSAVNGSVGTLTFESLEASNVGRCPVGVTLTLTAPDFRVDDLITVKWAAKMNSGLANAIFPNAIDAATKLPGAVLMSSLFACTFGTNCATNVGGTPTGADGTSTGPFSPDGTKSLETNTFSLKLAGDYIIAGLVSLPGDSTLDLSAEEYIVFKKISVMSANPSMPTSDPSAPSPDSMNASETAPKNDLDKQNANKESNANEGANSDPLNEPTSPAVTSSNEKTKETNAIDPGVVKSASTSSGKHNFFKDNGMIFVAVGVGCCVIGFIAFAFVICRRKDQRMQGKGSLPSDMDDHGGKVDLTYAANITARNKNNGTTTMMEEESSVVMMPSAERGSELAAHSLPKSSLDTDEYSDKASYGALGHGNRIQKDTFRVSNISSVAGQSEASMSNFGDSIVSARQKQYLQPNDWNEPAPANRRSRLQSNEKSTQRKSSFGGHSTVSRYSEDKTSRVTDTSDHDSNRGLGFSMSSRPTDARFTEDYHVTEEQHDTENFHTADFSKAMGQSRLQSEVSVDSYGFRTSRSSVDSYSSGMSSYSREGSRISRFSAASSLDRSSDISQY